MPRLPPSRKSPPTQRMLHARAELSALIRRCMDSGLRTDRATVRRVEPYGQPEGWRRRSVVRRTRWKNGRARPLRSSHCRITLPRWRSCSSAMTRAMTPSVSKCFHFIVKPPAVRHCHPGPTTMRRDDRTCRTGPMNFSISARMSNRIRATMRSGTSRRRSSCPSANIMMPLLMARRAAFRSG